MGKVTEGRLRQLGVSTVGQLRDRTPWSWKPGSGVTARAFQMLAGGTNPSPVLADRPVRSIVAEDTFAEDIPLAVTETVSRGLAEKV